MITALPEMTTTLQSTAFEPAALVCHALANARPEISLQLFEDLVSLDLCLKILIKLNDFKNRYA